MAALLSAEGVIFKNIIRYPDIRVEAGSHMFICGESGCGKSTLLKMFNGTVTPDAGVVTYNGADVAGLDAITLRHEVLLAGQPVFLFDKTIAENFTEFYAYRGLPAPDADTMHTFLSLCRAGFPLDMDCTRMSSGERQRVYLAIFASFKPNVLLLDEPTSALDEQNAASLMSALKGFCKRNGITLVTVTHDRELAGMLADSVVELNGRMCDG